jgi:low temperature requirement protein LtrA
MTTTRPWRRPMLARRTHEANRASTPLELFFDLCFVVAVAQASSSLHHAVSHGDLALAWTSYPAVFFAIWWAWMNFTWFSSAYDNDDALYRLVVLVQIAGALILAAGVPRAFADKDYGIVTLGYAVMRLALVTQWLRAARDDPEHRVTDVRYAIGVGVCMIGWGLRLLLPAGWSVAGLLVLIAAELLVPVWAERTGATTWHPRHIVERYGLFTLIVLGESVLAATVAFQLALDAGQALGDLIGIAVGGLLIVFSMWWLYFAQPAEDLLERARDEFGITSWHESFVWGYGHYVVFGSAAAVGAGIAVAVDQAGHGAEISSRGATLAVAIPVALFLLSVWALHLGTPSRARVRRAIPVTGVLLVVLASVGAPVLVLGLVLAGLVTADVVLA